VCGACFFFKKKKKILQIAWRVLFVEDGAKWGNFSLSV
jgi:hypothetical protein